jgi:hypothetical protein
MLLAETISILAKRNTNILWGFFLPMLHALLIVYISYFLETLVNYRIFLSSFIDFGRS